MIWNETVPYNVINDLGGLINLYIAGAWCSIDNCRQSVFEESEKSLQKMKRLYKVIGKKLGL